MPTSTPPAAEFEKVEPRSASAPPETTRAQGPALRRSLSLPLVVLYGLGTTVGAGIYALIGGVAGRAGMWAFASFAVASLLAMSTAASYAGLSARFPYAAAQAVFVREAFGRQRLATGVGLLVAISGALSAATVTNGFCGYLEALLPVPRPLAAVGVVSLLGAIACLGVRHSVGLAGLITAIEVGGLLLIVGFGSEALAQLPLRIDEFVGTAPPAGWMGIIGGSFLAFYAFLGFEDMVNVAEEVQDVRNKLPLAIGLTLIATLVLYVVIALTAVLVARPAELSESAAPLALIFERSGGNPRLLATIGVLAMINGALIQILMASRILFGLARDGELPRFLSVVNERTRAPVRATILTSVGVAGLALFFPITQLAESTSLFTLVVFLLVNASMLRLIRSSTRGPYDPPPILPWIGIVTNAGFLFAWFFV